MSLISIIIPVYNEEKNIGPFLDALIPVMDALRISNAIEILFIDDGSTDNSVFEIERYAVNDTRIRYLSFSRNFGKEMATTAGLNHAAGDACLMIDVDLQHPPKLIPRFIEKWNNGADVVIGVRKRNGDESWQSDILSRWYYWLINAIGDSEIVPHATDFRLLDRKVVNEFNRLTERERMTRGLIDWLGFKRETVEFDAPHRANGVQQYNTRKRLRLAITSIVSHSLKPLRLAGWLGIAITLVAGALGLFIFIERYVLGDPWGMNFSGPAILAVIILFLVGIMLSCLGLIALYIGTIKTEISGRPMYVIRKKSERKNSLNITTS